tara:strand:+ start:148 stop:1254 length:1107 start_codon:yes stop_codon:yes gene_type:complete
MAIINSYPTVTPTGGDLIIGTDVSTTPNSTKTFTVDSINALAPQGTVTSVALTMPAAFSVAGSPITSSGTLAVTGAGSNAQFIDGTGALQTVANLPFVDGTGTANKVSKWSDTDTLTDGPITFSSNDSSFEGSVTINGGSKNLTLGVTNPIIFLDGGGTERLRIAGDISNNSIIQDSSPGDLMLFSNTELEIKSGITGENFAKFTKDGPIELYYDNVKKFETTATGITVTGTQSSFSGQVTIPTTPVASTDAASKAYVDSQVGYSTYVARVTQSGTNAPVATVISNNTGLTFTWARNNVGSYTVSPSSAFVINKTWIQMTGGDLSVGTTSVSIKDIGTAFASAVNINLINGLVADNITAAFVEIRIYP